MSSYFKNSSTSTYYQADRLPDNNNDIASGL